MTVQDIAVLGTALVAWSTVLGLVFRLVVRPLMHLSEVTRETSAAVTSLAASVAALSVQLEEQAATATAASALARRTAGRVARLEKKKGRTL